MHQRFEVVKEPTDTWAVFDIVLNVPAEIRGRTLIGLSLEEANRSLLRLNFEILLPLQAQAQGEGE